MLLFGKLPMDTVVTSQKYATFYALAAVLCWSTVATAFKLTLAHVNPLQLILLSSVMSCLFLMTLLVWQGRFKELFSQSASAYRLSILFALMNPCLYYFLLFTAYDLLPAQEAQSINYSWAIVMSLLAVPLLAQKLSRFDIVAAILCYLGVLTIATRGDVFALDFANLNGVMYAVASTLVWSLYWIFNQKDPREPILGLCLNFSVAVPILLLVSFFTGDLLSIFDKPWQAFSGSLYIGIFEMGLAFVLWLKAMKFAENTARIANLIFISPFLSLIFINVFLGEKILFSTLIGLGMIIAGLILQQRFAKSNDLIEA
jgi:drug/metabolite transporter (DMT)-like permease